MIKKSEKNGDSDKSLPVTSSKNDVTRIEPAPVGLLDQWSDDSTIDSNVIYTQNYMN